MLENFKNIELCSKWLNFLVENVWKKSWFFLRRFAAKMFEKNVWIFFAASRQKCLKKMFELFLPLRGENSWKKCAGVRVLRSLKMLSNNSCTVWTHCFCKNYSVSCIVLLKRFIMEGQNFYIECFFYNFSLKLA